jgi:dolichyl-phosphate-mannose--protein O-mannosyl transferase
VCGGRRGGKLALTNESFTARRLFNLVISILFLFDFHFSSDSKLAMAKIGAWFFYGFEAHRLATGYRL